MAVACAAVVRGTGATAAFAGEITGTRHFLTSIGVDPGNACNPTRSAGGR